MSLYKKNRLPITVSEPVSESEEKMTVHMDAQETVFADPYSFEEGYDRDTAAEVKVQKHEKSLCAARGPRQRKTKSGATKAEFYKALTQYLAEKSLKFEEVRRTDFYAWCRSHKVKLPKSTARSEWFRAYPEK